MRASSVILLPHAPTSVAIARRRLRSVLRDSGVGQEVIDDANVVVSELLSNALRHARPLPSGQVRVVWNLGDGLLEVAVSDGGSQTEPRKGPGTLSSLGGRGLGIVETLARDWGVRHDGGATTVWATLSAPTAGSGAAAPSVRHPAVAMTEFTDLNDFGGSPDSMTVTWHEAPRPRSHPA